MRETSTRASGAQLSTLSRIGLLARTALLLFGIALACWGGHLPVTACVLIAVALIFRLLTLFEEPMYQPSIVVTEQDALRLSGLLESLPREQRLAVCALEVELERAHVVKASKVPADVVTMNSRVLFEEVHTGMCTEASLVYPGEPTQAEPRGISVLAPVGSALLGLCVGHAIDWRMPNGRLRRYRVLDVLYQPEAAGDLHL